MKYSPVPYRYSDTEHPVGAYNTDLGNEGWSNAKYDHNPNVVLTSGEVEEFASLIYSFYKEYKDLKMLESFKRKHCIELPFDGFEHRFACRFECKLLDYNVEISGTHVTFYPFRKENAQ